MSMTNAKTVKYSKPAPGEENLRFVVLSESPEFGGIPAKVTIQAIDWPFGKFAPIETVFASEVCDA